MLMLMFSIAHLCLSEAFSIILCLILCKGILNTVEDITRTLSYVGCPLCPASETQSPEQIGKMDDRKAGVFPLLSLALYLASSAPSRLGSTTLSTAPTLTVSLDTIFLNASFALQVKPASQAVGFIEF